VFDGASGQQVIGAVQARHAELMAELVRHARVLPPDADDQAALEHGGEVRESYLATRDLVSVITQLREAVALVEGAPSFVLDGLDICLAYERTGRLYRTAWLAPITSTTHGDIGSFPFYLSACRETSYEWRLPSAAEQAARGRPVAHEAAGQPGRGARPSARVLTQPSGSVALPREPLRLCHR
jgi:hypothetical protein